MSKRIIILAVVAIVAALTGASFAGAGVEPSQPVSTSGPTEYPVAPAKATSQVLRAQIAADGSFVKGSVGVTSNDLGTGTYEVIFPRNVVNCIYVATLAEPGSFSTGGPGEVGVTGRAGNVNGVFVNTYTSAGAGSDQPFNILVACKPPKA